MADWVSRLRALREPINVGIVGVGSIGKGLVFQARLTPGIRCVAVADVRLERAVGAAQAFGIPHRVVRTLGAMHDAVRAGELAVCDDGDFGALRAGAGGCSRPPTRSPQRGRWRAARSSAVRTW